MTCVPSQGHPRSNLLKVIWLWQWDRRGVQVGRCDLCRNESSSHQHHDCHAGTQRVQEGLFTWIHLNNNYMYMLIMVTVITSLPKVVWEEGRVPALSHTYAVKSPLVTMARPKFAPKVPIPVHRSPNPTTCLIRGPVRSMMLMPNGIRIRSAVFPQCTGQTDRRTYRPTHRPTDRPRENVITIGRCATRATRPNNNKVTLSRISHPRI